MLSNPPGATIGTGTATVTIINDDNALLAATAEDHPVEATQVSETDLGPIVVEAKRRLALAGLDTATLSKLDHVTVQIADLDGQLLGLELGDTVLIDRDAAGFGWFVDQTPRDDGEFVNNGIVTAASGATAGRMDLLTVVAHELGHAAGLDHDEPTDGNTHDVMEAELTPGARHLPASFEISYVLSPVSTSPEPKPVAMLASSIGQQGLAELLLGDALVGKMARLLAGGPTAGQTPVSTMPDLWQESALMEDAPNPEIFTSFSAKARSVRLVERPMDDSAWSDLMEPDITDDIWWNNGDTD